MVVINIIIYLYNYQLQYNLIMDTIAHVHHFNNSKNKK